MVSATWEWISLVKITIDPSVTITYLIYSLLNRLKHKDGKVRTCIWRLYTCLSPSLHNPPIRTEKSSLLLPLCYVFPTNHTIDLSATCSIPPIYNASPPGSGVYGLKGEKCILISFIKTEVLLARLLWCYLIQFGQLNSISLYLSLCYCYHHLMSTLPPLSHASDW